jgi:cyclic pyranopterin phosphate synthase
MPEADVEPLQHKDILSFEEITAFVSTAAKHGVDKIRLTGGEPLVRKGVVELVKMIAQIQNINDLALTTNGILLPRFAQDLREAGLHRINISLDTLDADQFKHTTRGGALTEVLAGIEAALAAGFPIKLNCVVEKSREEKNAQQVLKYAQTKGIEVRFIQRMNLQKGEFHIVDGGTGGDCANCNRLRLTSDGKLYSCLFNDIHFNIRELEYAELLNKAVQAKPKAGQTSFTKHFYTTGG